MLKRSFTVQVCCQVLANVFRLVEIPALMLILGLDEGGKWLLLQSIASISAISDGGLSQGLSRSIQIHGNDEEATGVLWNGAYLSSLACVAVLPFVLAGGHFIFQLQRVELISVGALYLSESLGLGQEFMNSWFQRFERTDGALISNFFHGLCPFFGMLIGFLIFDSIWVAGFCVLLLRMIVLLSSIHFLRKIVPPFCIPKLAKIVQFPGILLTERRGIVSAFSMLLVNWGASELPKMIVGFRFGLADVSLYTALSRYCRILGQLIIVIYPAMPAISRALREKNKIRVKYVADQAYTFAILSTVSAGGILVGISGVVFPIWSSGKISPSMLLVAAFMLAVGAENVWRAALVIKISTNDYAKDVIYFAYFNMIAIGIFCFVPWCTLLGYGILAAFFNLISFALLLYRSNLDEMPSLFHGVKLIFNRLLGHRSSSLPKS